MRKKYLRIVGVSEIGSVGFVFRLSRLRAIRGRGADVNFFLIWYWLLLEGCTPLPPFWARSIRIRQLE